MKTTLSISDVVMKRLKEEAAQQGKTMSEIVETALRGLFDARRRVSGLPPLPSFESCGVLVDLASRNSLYDAMEH